MESSHYLQYTTRPRPRKCPTSFLNLFQCLEDSGDPGHVNPDLEAGAGAPRVRDGHQPHPGQRAAGPGGQVRRGEPAEDPQIQGEWWRESWCFVLICFQVSLADSWENVPAQLVEGRSDYQIVRDIPKTVR